MYARTHYSDYGTNGRLICPQPDPSILNRLAKFGLLNAFGMGIEYTITHAVIITGFPLRYREITDFTKTYLLSPLALIGRGTIWVGKGLYVASDPQPLFSEDFGISDLFYTASSDLIAAAAVDVVYALGSQSMGHQNLLIEKTFVDTFVTSIASQIVRPVVKNTLEYFADNCCGFWRRSQYSAIAEQPRESGGRRMRRGGDSDDDL
jgi:hypothetical protein